MAAITKAIHVSKTINNVVKLLTNLSVKTETAPLLIPAVNKTSFNRHCLVHTTSRKNESKKLMQFFDEEINWGKKHIKVGRSWNMDELRIKSNEDLHKLWYILLKERNMLLTMEDACERHVEVFPNPERIDKVAISMENLEAVVRERNKAYHMLETGKSGERPAKVVRNAIGLPFVYRLREHNIPMYMNTKWKKNHIHSFKGYAVTKFLNLYAEKHSLMRRRLRNQNANKVLQFLRHFPNVDMEAIKEQYPDVDIERVRKRRRCRGHFINTN